MTTQIIKTDLKKNKNSVQWWKSFNIKGFNIYFLSYTLPLSFFLRNGQHSGLSASKDLEYTVTQAVFFFLLSHWDREGARTEMWRQAHYWTKPSFSRSGGKTECDKKAVFVPICTISSQETASNIYRTITQSGLSGINSSETAACSTCLEILVEFQEPSAMTCFCFSHQNQGAFTYCANGWRGEVG